LRECLSNFEVKTYLRVKELKQGNINYPGILKNEDNISIKINIPQLDYTKHELESFVELIQDTKGIHTIMFFDTSYFLLF
jgi:hypothetical protein